MRTQNGWEKETENGDQLHERPQVPALYRPEEEHDERQPKRKIQACCVWDPRRPRPRRETLTERDR